MGIKIGSKKVVLASANQMTLLVELLMPKQWPGAAVAADVLAKYRENEGVPPCDASVEEGAVALAIQLKADNPIEALRRSLDAVAALKTAFFQVGREYARAEAVAAATEEHVVQHPEWR